MQVIKSLTASQPALAVISRDRVRLRAEPSDIMVLDYLIRFVNADGTNVEGFAPGYTIVNVAANYTINENLKVFARADNLFDLRYQDPTGFLRPGLGVYAGVRMTN